MNNVTKMKLIQTILQRLDYVKKLGSDPDLREQIRKIPKYELHVHLGGSIRRSTIVDLAEKNGVSLPTAKKVFLEAPLPLAFFTGDIIWELFHNAYKWHWSCVKSCEDLQRIVFEFLEDSSGQGVVHSEITVSGSYLMSAFPFDEWTDAVRIGIEEAKKKFSINGIAIFDISRRSGKEKAIENVRLLIDRRPYAIAAIGMGGDESVYPHADYKDAFDLARKKNIHRTVHTSELTHGNTTMEAISELNPERLGHALNTFKSTRAYEALKKSGLHVESCPLCNFVSGIGNLQSLKDHPARKYFMDGIPLSINSDVPRIFGFDLIDNYICLMKELDFSIHDLEMTNKNAQKSSFTA